MKNIIEISQTNTHPAFNWDQLICKSGNGINAKMGTTNSSFNNAKNVKTNTEKAIVEKNDIESLLKSNWAIIDHNIRVKVIGTKVIIRGIVHSLFQKAEVNKIVWNIPGVWMVENKVVVKYRNYQID